MDLTEVLRYIPPSSLDYTEWVNIGMALKHEGYTVDVWDSWSRPDSRYKAGNCEKKWGTFKENSSEIVTGGTICEIAKRFGYSPEKREIKILDWDDEIEYDGNPDAVIKDTAWLDTSSVIEIPKEIKGTDELRRFIQALFKPDEYVGFCVDAMFDEDQKKWKPSTRGVYKQTAKQLLDAIKKHPKDIADTIGDYNQEAGAWIRFNPLDGEGVSNENVTDYRFALVESDTLELEKQKALIEELKLPVAIMTFSGKKSVHAIVRIDAITEQDYREKVDYLYKVCEKNGLFLDKQNKNPSRMSRMPGVIRGDKKQFILAENIGLPTFDEWRNYIEDLEDTLPDIVSYGELKELPPLSPELITGVLRRGHKMTIAGPSKAGKSFLLIELALCITNGKRWIGFECSKGKVLYINLEVDSASFLHRVSEVEKAMGLTANSNLDIWNLRGEQTDIAHLAPRLIRRAANKNYDAIIFDPLYKINQGDENNASEMAKFFNTMDKICTKLKTSIICCHHHSKGAQGGKFSMDRASGSGVFARDPDALLDMIEINPRDVEKSLEKGQTAWRVSSTLREFVTPDDIDIIFDYPVHRITEDLKGAMPMSGMDKTTNSRRGNAVKKGKKEQRYERLCAFIENWDEIDTKPNHSKYPTLQEAVEYFKSDKGFSKNTIRNWIDEYEDIELQNGMLFLVNKEGE
jgi:RecA-family ATPase